MICNHGNGSILCIIIELEIVLYDSKKYINMLIFGATFNFLRLS